MTATFPQRYRELGQGISALGQAQPEIMDGFSRMHRAVATDGALSAKHKELMALAIGISSQCTGCIAFHVHDAIKAGATREEIAETVGVVVMMGGGPAVIYGIEAMDAFDQFAT